jgi:hypothetical protein
VSVLLREAGGGLVDGPQIDPTYDGRLDSEWRGDATVTRELRMQACTPLTPDAAGLPPRAIRGAGAAPDSPVLRHETHAKVVCAVCGEDLDPRELEVELADRTSPG